MLASKSILIAAFGLLFVSTNFAQKQKENYSEIFSSDYQRAVKFLQTGKGVDSIIQSHGFIPREVTAIIFPELIRYNSIQDKIETFALETLYVQYGKDYANFSVGEFQIKPSFAERIEIDFLKKFGGKELQKYFQINSSDTIQSQENRSKRLKRIKSKTGMVNYLCLFWELMNSKYFLRKNEERIRFLATAYNCGYWKSLKDIKSFQSKKFFHTGLSISSTKYNYADIAWYYYQQP
ncbi:MAG TPA: hypothetical protein VGQ59_21800 [Cyclobacteriaceae bacterium]|nr:hypothetical protein [Cyclobacteriaceae bacterium]